MSANTRTRILVTSLMLFNDKGVPSTTTNEIADEMDISPGNLHYHFRRKSDLVEALLAEFQADARRVLHRPDVEHATLDDFWIFLHYLLELKAAYVFLLRDVESLVADYPKVEVALKHFARGVIATFELYLRALAKADVLMADAGEMQQVARNLAVIVLLSDKLDGILGDVQTADNAALQTAESVLSLLRPLVSTGSREQFDELLALYGSL